MWCLVSIHKLCLRGFYGYTFSDVAHNCHFVIYSDIVMFDRCLTLRIWWWRPYPGLLQDKGRVGLEEWDLGSVTGTLSSLTLIFVSGASVNTFLHNSLTWNFSRINYLVISRSLVFLSIGSISSPLLKGLDMDLTSWVLWVNFLLSLSLLGNIVLTFYDFIDCYILRFSMRW